MISLDTACIQLDFIENGLTLTIDAKKTDSFFENKNAEQEGECRYQIKEGCFYDYEFSNPDYLFKKTDYIQPHSRKPHIGVISPNIYVGALTFEIIKKEESYKPYKIKLEVQSIKTDYRTDYRFMLESITEKCTDLIMQIDSPITQHFETDFNKNTETLYQRFSFVKSLIDSLEFEEAIQKIVSSPTTKWEEEYEEKDIHRIGKFNQKNIKQLVTKNNRMELSSNHFLSINYGLNSIPIKIDSTRKTESIDTAENRFIKHALNEFLFFCENCETKFEKHSTAKFESGLLTTKISSLLNQSFFKQISRPNSLKLNSPVLQRKSGYSEVLNSWLKFDLAAKLIWKGGDNVYDAGKKDVAVLYEYWLFFKLLDVLKELFDIEPKVVEELIKETDDGLGLQLKQGRHIPLKGIYNKGNRKLHIEFSYNRAFGGKKAYPDSGSWTKNMRPDYTLTIWPFGISQQQAEKEEIIVHIHFDAKYKIENLSSIFGDLNKNELSEEDIQTELSSEKNEQIKGTFKRIDLLKMHAYKDAIRRTGGAYVLYPGSEEYIGKGFHEIIPGLGAFPISPSKSNDGTKELKKFLNEIIEHFLNRASQREKISLKAYETYNTNEINKVNERIPEYSDGKKLIPDETYILVGYSTSTERFEWYKEKGKYIFRMDEAKGSLELSKEVVSAKYLLLRKNGTDEASDLFKIKSKGPKVFSNSQLEKLNYPLSEKPKEYYLAIDIEAVNDKEFENVIWKFKDLEQYKSIIKAESNIYTKVGLPFTVTLTELMNVVKK